MAVVDVHELVEQSGPGSLIAPMISSAMALWITMTNNLTSKGQISSGGDATLTVGNDINLSSAADEHNIESRDKKGKKKIHEIDNESRQ
ncbi:hypothetical protein [Pseudomonas sp. NPDC089734]|uniref:hypothetical protein n=1 Tax=Pseudomonas sp. NPDC089734 TaxID=3364469 RepID=UPI00381E6BAA